MGRGRGPPTGMGRMDGSEFATIVGAVIGALLAGAAGILTARYMHHLETGKSRRAMALSLLVELMGVATVLLTERQAIRAGTKSAVASGAALREIVADNLPARQVLPQVVGDLGLLEPACVHAVLEFEHAIHQLKERRRSLATMRLQGEADVGYCKNLLGYWDPACHLAAVAMCRLAREAGRLDGDLLREVGIFAQSLTDGAEPDALKSDLQRWLATLRGGVVDAARWTG